MVFLDVTPSSDMTNLHFFLLLLLLLLILGENVYDNRQQENEGIYCKDLFGFCLSVSFVFFVLSFPLCIPLRGGAFLLKAFCLGRLLHDERGERCHTWEEEGRNPSLSLSFALSLRFRKKNRDRIVGAAGMGREGFKNCDSPEKELLLLFFLMVVGWWWWWGVVCHTSTPLR